MKRFIAVRVAILAALTMAFVTYYVWPFVEEPALLVNGQATTIVLERLVAALPFAALLIPLDFLIAWWGYQVYRKWSTERRQPCPSTSPEPPSASSTDISTENPWSSS